jgi:hypothetical protein
VRTLLRYLFFFGVLVGLAFVVVSVEIGGETIYRRYRMHQLWPKASRWLDSTWASWSGPHDDDDDEKSAPAKPKAKPDRRAKERVAILRRATRAASPEVKRLPPKGKTRVDARASPQQKKALDELVSSRVGRR